MWHVMDSDGDLLNPQTFATRALAEEWTKLQIESGGIVVGERFKFLREDGPWYTFRVSIEEAKEQS